MIIIHKIILKKKSLSVGSRKFSVSNIIFLMDSSTENSDIYDLPKKCKSQ